MIVTPHTVRRLHFRGRLENPRLARHRLEAALSEGAEASRLGEEAILCVRRLTIPLRRVEKLKDALEGETRTAARPARGPVPANANAVLFADRAELLACLARDWCSCNVTAQWWWPVLFPRDDFGAIVGRAWLQDARPVPAALARLESAGLAQPFLTRLARGDVAALWRTMVNTFQLETIEAAWSASDIPNANPFAKPPLRDAPPWSPWINPPASLNMDAARVLITAILLERAPGRIRSLSFAREIREWGHPNGIRDAPDLVLKKIIPSAEDASRSELHQDVPASTSSRSTAGPEPPTKDSILPVGQPIAESSAGRAPSPRQQRQRRSLDSRTHKDRRKRARGTKGDPMTSPAASDDTGPSDATLVGDGSTKSSSPRREPANTPATTTDQNVAVPSAASPDVIATAWGGSFYLVNVAIALGLYGDFTTTARTGLALSLWDFLALLCSQMIGEEFAEDPLPFLFARLSGRAEGEPPAGQFEPPTGEPLGIWLERICHDVRSRVAASVGLGDDCNLRAPVLNQQAKIETNSTRLDAYFSLAEHPIELRLAGLDRDPGWVPAGGRSIYFHYD